MSDAAEPTPPPPAGPDKTPAQVAAVTTMVAGVAIAACSFTPAFTVTSGAGTQAFPYSGTSHGPLVVVAGVLVAALGIGRYLADRTAFRVLSGLLGGGVIWAAFVDNHNLVTTAGSQVEGSGSTFIPGSALLLVGIAGLVALGSSFAQGGSTESTRGKVDQGLVAAGVILAVVVGAMATSNHSSAPVGIPTPSVTAPPPVPVTQVTQVTPTVRGVYPTETEIDFLQACEASASSFANAKCNCDLSLLESNVSLQRMMAIESNTAVGQPLPDDVSAMFDSCKAATG